MAYISTEEVKAIRDILKKEFPDVKFSVRKRHNISVEVTVVSTKDPELDFSEYVGRCGYVDVNVYWCDRDFKGPQRLFLKRVLQIIKTAPVLVGGREWFQESDPMSDYFNTAYFISLGIGRYDKPYEFKGSSREAA